MVSVCQLTEVLQDTVRVKNNPWPQPRYIGSPPQPLDFDVNNSTPPPPRAQSATGCRGERGNRHRYVGRLVITRARPVSCPTYSNTRGTNPSLCMSSLPRGGGRNWKTSQKIGYSRKQWLFLFPWNTVRDISSSIIDASEKLLKRVFIVLWYSGLMTRVSLTRGRAPYYVR